MKVILVCTSGISSGYYARKCQRALADAGITAECQAAGQPLFLKKKMDADLVLVGPITDEALEKVTKHCISAAIPFLILKADEYARMDTGRVTAEVVRLKNQQ